jgi:fatty-acyl-CoA synthase
VVEPARQGEASFEHVSCGPTFEGHEVAAFDDHGHRLPEGQEGELRLRGPSVTPGYFNNPEGTAAAFQDGWLHTGDLGYLLDGEVYVTGRLKDLIILNGRNLHPQAIEWVAGEVEGVRQGNVVAFSRMGRDSEELIVVLETRADDPAELERIKADVARRVRQEVGVAPVDIVALQPGSLPKTSSGKLQRRKTRTQYLAGELGRDGTRTMGTSGDKLTVARHVAASMWTRAKAAVFGS